MPKTISGSRAMKILCRNFGFFFVSQKGSHAKLKKSIGNKEIITIVPLHKELAKGTLRGVLELARVDEKEFWESLK